MNEKYVLPWDFLDSIHGTKKNSIQKRNHMPQAKMMEVLRLIDLHLSGAEISRRTGVSQSHVSKIKNHPA